VTNGGHQRQIKTVVLGWPCIQSAALLDVARELHKNSFGKPQRGPRGFTMGGDRWRHSKSWWMPLLIGIVRSWSERHLYNLILELINWCGRPPWTTVKAVLRQVPRCFESVKRRMEHPWKSRVISVIILCWLAKWGAPTKIPVKFCPLNGELSVHTGSEKNGPGENHAWIPC